MKYETPQPWKSDNGEFGKLVEELSEHFKNESMKATPPDAEDLGAAARKKKQTGNNKEGKKNMEKPLNTKKPKPQEVVISMRNAWTEEDKKRDPERWKEIEQESQEKKIDSNPEKDKGNEKSEEESDKSKAFKEIKEIKEVRVAIGSVYNNINREGQILQKKIKPEDFINEVIERVINYTEPINENGTIADTKKGEVGIKIEDIIKNPKNHYKTLEAVIKRAAGEKAKEILGEDKKPNPEDAKKQKKSGLKIERPENNITNKKEPVASATAPENPNIKEEIIAPEKFNKMSFKSGDIVKVFNKNLGKIEDGWTVAGIKKDGKIRVELYNQPYGKKSRYFKRKTETLSKDVTPEELKEWQSAKNEPENEAPFKSGDIVKVLIGKEDKNLLSDEGEMQDDWRVIGINNDGTISVKWKGKLGLPKDVPLEDLKKWNNVNDEPVVPENIKDSEAEKRKEKTRKERQEKTEKIKAELELARKDYAEIRHKKLKAWNDLGNHFGKEYVQKEFDKDSEVLLMKKAYQDKLTEYKNALILGISEGFIRQEEIIDMMLDEINKMYDADIDVRKKNNETFFSYANYHKIFSPEKETDIHQENISFHADNLMIKEVDNLILNELDKLEPGENHDDAVKLIRSDAVKEYAYSHGMTIDEAMKKLSKDNNGTKFSITHDSAGLLHAHFNEKIVTKDDGMPENAVVQQDSKNNVKSELQELIKAKFKNINDTKETAINIKDSIFGKSDNIFSVWKGENVTEIIKSKESRKDFLEKIPKTGKTFFNELIKQVPPESGDTMRRWIARVAIEAKKQKE